MKATDYKQLLKFVHENTMGFGEIFYKLGAEKLNELREHHEKFKRESDKWSIYAHQELSNLIKYKNWIEEFCKENKIMVIFTRKETLEWRKGFYAYYSYNGVQFTDLIVFNGKKN